MANILSLSSLLTACTVVGIGVGGYQWWHSEPSIESKRERVVSELNERGVEDSPSGVMELAKDGAIEDLEILGELGVSFDGVDMDGNDAIHIAMDHHQWGALEVVRRYAKDHDTLDGEGRTPLEKLLAKGYLNLAQNFVDHGASVDFKIATEGGDVPASIYYLQSGDKKNFDFVIDNAAELDVHDGDGRSLLQLAIEGGRISEGMKLLKYGADASELKIFGKNALIEFIEDPSKYDLDEEEQMALIAGLIQGGADVNVVDGDLQKPLTVAMEEGSLSVFELLLEYAEKDQGYVWEAIHFQRPEMLCLLLQSGLESDIRNEDGETPLMAMVEQGDTRAAEVIKVLLDHGADADQITASGQRAVFAAIAGRRSEVAQVLIGHSSGADVHEPMLYPVRAEFRGLFGKKGLFDWYCRNVRGLTPLMAAVLTDELDVAEALIKKGARRNQQTQARSYPIQMAAGMKNVKMQQLILGVPYDNDKQERQYIIDLSDQRAYLYKGGKLIKSSRCSTGKSGYRTPTGVFVVTDKQKHKVSNIYKNAKMPYFQRFSCKDIGFHQGNTYAGFLSHGCIRLPMSNAKFFFNNSKVGDRVTIRR